MSKPYWSGGRGGSTYADPEFDSHDSDSSYPGRYGYPDTGATDALDLEQDYEDYDSYTSGYDPGRWRWIAGIAAVILFVAVVAIASMLNNDSAVSVAPTDTAAPSQDSAATSKAPSTTPRTVTATVPPTASSPAVPLPPETVVTVSPSATHPGVPAPAPDGTTAAPERTITYTVTGSRQLFDLVTIIYTDEQGFPRTDVNVALPWNKTVVLNPGVQAQSVTATSITGQLNCTITDGSGTVTVAQNNNALIATCTK